MMNKLFLAIGLILAAAVTCGSPAAFQTAQIRTMKTDYVCLDLVVKNKATEGRWERYDLFISRPRECETVVMVSPLVDRDRELLWKNAKKRC